MSLFIHCLALLKSLHPDTYPMIPLFPPSCWSSVSSSEDKCSTYQSEKQILRPREASRPPNSWSVLGSHCQFQRCLSRVTLNGKTRKPKRFTAALTSGVIWWLQANTDIPHYTWFWLPGSNGIWVRLFLFSLTLSWFYSFGSLSKQIGNKAVGLVRAVLVYFLASETHADTFKEPQCFYLSGVFPLHWRARDAVGVSIAECNRHCQRL